MASICAFSSSVRNLLADLFEPFGGNVGRADSVHLFQALEDVAEHLVEPVDVLLVLHEGRP